ncbi:YncE family protein [Mycolicibacterium mucogenicum]|uniref:YncE family protein n=1 Tax=Mycolicibacterium mucogenicum TaxID=56689 RepID=UPI00226A76E4|nr:YncE family protein [Mycolicibacterium mucogenicum]MCX8563642.1 YncE family protein [Mycolicibacterium mucogenicum]
MLAVIATIPDSGGPRAAVPSPNGDRLYVGNIANPTVSVIATVSNTVIDTIGPGGALQGLQQLVVHPDGTRLYCNSFGAMSVIDINTKSVVAVVPFAWGGQLAIHPDGSTVYLASGGDSSGNADPQIMLVDTATNAVTGTIKVDGAYYLAVSPDGARLYVTGYNDGLIWAVDTASHSVVKTYAVNKPIGGFVVSPDSSRLYVLGEVKFGVTTSNVTVVDVDTGTVTTGITFPLGQELTDIAVAPDGSAVYATQLTGDVSRIDSATMTVSDTVNIGNYAGAVTVSPDGSRIYATNQYHNTVSVLAQLHVLAGGLDLPDLVGKLFGGAAAGGGGWLVIGDHFIPIPPREPVLQAIARALAPHVGKPVQNHELGQRLRRTLAAEPEAPKMAPGSFHPDEHRPQH